MKNRSANKAGRPRPRFLRALGKADPPLGIELDGYPYRRIDIFKHDSWAATALYEGERGKVVAKFNRRQSIFGLPMHWLGRLLAAREALILQLLADLPNVPRCSGQITISGAAQPHAVAHDYVEGHPFERGERVDDNFFSMLQQLVEDIHDRDLAYVDLSKRENIIVGDDGQPYLVDFQISFFLPDWWPGNSWPMRKLLQLAQGVDDYLVLKHFHNSRPDLLTAEQQAIVKHPPWLIRTLRSVGDPIRSLRRRVLVLLGVRTGRGRVESEHAPEDAVRRRIERSKKSIPE
jgi:hypothetical protein